MMTGDIAYSMRLATHRVRSLLLALERKGCVEKVVEGGKGLPTSWRRTPAGLEALREVEER